MKIKPCALWKGLAVCLMALVAGVILIWSSQQVAEPTYQGKKLGEWIQALDGQYLPKAASPAEEQAARKAASRRYDEAEQALNAMGTNAVPYLVAVLNGGDSSFRARTKEFLLRYTFVRPRPGPAGNRRYQAVRACRILGPKAEGAVPALLVCLKDKDPDIRMTAGQALDNIRKQRHVVVPH